MLRAAAEMLGASSFYPHCVGTEQAERDVGWGPKSTLKIDVSPLASCRDNTPSAGTLIIIFPLLWEQFHPSLFSLNCLDTISNLIRVRQILKIYVFHSKHDVNCWQALRNFVMPKMAAYSGPFQNMRSTMFPNCCVLVPVHMKYNRRLKYPTGNEGTSVCLRAVLAISQVIRKYLLTSPLFSSVEQGKIKNICFLPVFLSYLLILARLQGQECLAMCAQTLQHHTGYQILAWLEASSRHSSKKEQELLSISKRHLKTDPAVALLKTPTASALELVRSSSDIFLRNFSSQTTIQNNLLLLSAMKVTKLVSSWKAQMSFSPCPQKYTPDGLPL